MRPKIRVKLIMVIMMGVSRSPFLVEFRICEIVLAVTQSLGNEHVLYLGVPEPSQLDTTAACAFSVTLVPLICFFVVPYAPEGGEPCH